ncbi:MAG: hypothetical protein IPG71_00080 [bacterium]|nr:hypothetical protein [bacterium]
MSGYQSDAGPYSIRVEPRSINRVDSLVIRSTGTTVELNWENVGVQYYYIYRSLSGDQASLYTTPWGFAATNSWSESQPIATQLYYAVSPIPEYAVPALLAAGLGTRPMAEVYAEAMAQLKTEAPACEAIDFYPGTASDCVELAPTDKQAAKQDAGVHLFGPGISIENQVAGKNYSAQ